ncbi:unnamed protein product [Rotaria sp. Silwood2]|nr:unnamed protein product [Rotaria sp. Silwood2]CAF3258947.1 unnamed protein product [Rotaria sp. Silwood2]CAF3454248.1 unnamed protein product [Rotaria sp. Silwood2]CAF4244330.1 unnamed protein product [Rotaria sp. Silwood2]CAF4402230.1 unnamed protein product [Rotaria sp. Silwood2]
MDMNFSYNDEFFNSSDEDNHDDFDAESAISPTIRFWILLISSIPSIICSLLVLCLLLSHQEHRRTLNHRVVIIQLIGGLIYLLTHFPIYINYLRLGYVWPQTPAMCHLWWFVGDGFSDTMTILMAWASFERHILIFHDQWVSTTRKRFFAHYLPVTLIITYCPIYYLIVMVFPPCENIYDYNEKLCSSSCLYQNIVLLLYDAIINDILATILVATFSISLIIRVLWHNHIRYHRQIQWRKHRKIIIILMSISTIYLAFNLPMMILDFAQICGLSQDIVDHFEPYFEFLNYFIFIFYPFICLGTMLTKFRRPRGLVGTIPMTVIPRSKSQMPQAQQLY